VTDQTEHLEVEVKFFVPDLAALRQKLLAAGAILAKPRIYERNIRLDTADNQLWQRQELLRLRQDTAVVVTFKGMPLKMAHSEAKVREELEMRVDDFEMAAAIFQRLGFEPKQIYEKYRETYHFGDVEVVLDEMPFGNFVEVEGEEVAIRQAAAVLGLDWRNRILANYLALMAQLKTYHQLPFDDLTFANFKDLRVSISDILV
jgi:adenylate cyclase class 2